MSFWKKDQSSITQEKRLSQVSQPKAGCLAGPEPHPHVALSYLWEPEQSARPHTEKVCQEEEQTQGQAAGLLMLAPAQPHSSAT